MKVTISGKQMKVPASFKDAVEEHLVRPLTHFYDNQAAELHVEVGNALPHKRGDHIECHVTLHLPGLKTLHLEENGPEPLASLGAVAERLVRAAKKELERVRDPRHGQAEHPLANSPRE